VRANYRKAGKRKDTRKSISQHEISPALSNLRLVRFRVLQLVKMVEIKSRSLWVGERDSNQSAGKFESLETKANSKPKPKSHQNLSKSFTQIARAEQALNGEKPKSYDFPLSLYPYFSSLRFHQHRFCSTES